MANTVALRDTVHRSGASDILVLALCSEKAPAKGQLYETAPDSLAGVRWQRSGGVDFEYEDGIPSAEDVTKVSRAAECLGVTNTDVGTLNSAWIESATSTMDVQTIPPHPLRVAAISTQKAQRVRDGYELLILGFK